MASPDSSSRTHPLVLLTLLGCLGISFIMLIRRGDEIPGVSERGIGRGLSSHAETQRMKQDLHKAFLGINAWEELCRDPQAFLSRLSLDGVRHLRVENPLWEKARPNFPSTERDASFRCRSAHFEPDELRSKFCFNVAGAAPLEANDVNMLELNLEWYGKKDPRRPLSCTEALASDSDLELAVYYSYYRALDRKAEEWTFLRLAGGMRLVPLRFKMLSSSAPSVLSTGG